MIESFDLVTKEVAEHIGDTAVEAGMSEALELPEKIGDLSDEEELPDKIELVSEDDLEIISLGAFTEQHFLDVSKTNASEEGAESDNTETKTEGLTEEEKAKIKEETGWSDEIINAIGSMKEYEVYKKAGLVEAEIDGKKCLIRNDIDWEQKDYMGRTNKERAEQGLSPINKDGKVIELHHIGQHADSPLAELTTEEHRGKGNDTILHDKTKESDIDRQAFASERSAHWEARANGGGNQS